MTACSIMSALVAAAMSYTAWLLYYRHTIILATTIHAQNIWDFTYNFVGDSGLIYDETRYFPPLYACVLVG